MLASIVDSNAFLHVVANRSVQAMVGVAISAGRCDPRGGGAVARRVHGDLLSRVFQSALDRLADRLAAELLIEYIVPVGSKPVDVKLGVRLAGAHVRGLGVAPR